jgi:WhiB family redox-sensing transcriptional regulator
MTIAEIPREAVVSEQDQSWRYSAACSDQLYLFFARNAERPQARARREAKARNLCMSCPVQLTCRDFARENHQYGFWGGESESERHLAGFSLAAPIGIRGSRKRQQPTGW